MMAPLPAIVDDDEPTKPSAQKKETRKKQESSDDDDDADEDMKRRLRMLRSHELQRPAPGGARSKLAESDDEPVDATYETAARSVEAPPKPYNETAALLKIKIRTEGGGGPLDYEIRRTSLAAELL